MTRSFVLVAPNSGCFLEHCESRAGRTRDIQHSLNRTICAVPDLTRQPKHSETLPITPNWARQISCIERQVSCSSTSPSIQCQQVIEKNLFLWHVCNNKNHMEMFREQTQLFTRPRNVSAVCKKKYSCLEMTKEDQQCRSKKRSPKPPTDEMNQRASLAP